MKFTNKRTEGLSIGSGTNERFKVLATYRVNAAAKFIKRIGNLANKTNYKYTAEDVDKIFEYLESEIKESKLQFKHAIQQSTLRIYKKN
jgi:hypothetical protein